MAKDDGKPGDETLTAAFDEVKRDGAAWLSAEQQLLQARFQNGVRRVALAALLAVVAVMVTIAATVTLANMLVDLLTPVAGRVLAGAIVAIGLLIVGAVLGLWIKSLVHS